MSEFLFYQYLADGCWFVVWLYVVFTFSKVLEMWRSGHSFDRVRIGLSFGALILFIGYYSYLIIAAYENRNHSVFLEFGFQAGSLLVALCGFVMALFRPIRLILAIVSVSALNGFASMMVVSPRNHAKLECFAFVLMWAVLYGVCRKCCAGVMLRG